MPANPHRAPGEWHVFRVAGVRLPGIAKVTGCVDSSKLDVRKGKGSTGVTVVYDGDDTKTFKVELHLLTEEDLDEWDTGEGRRILSTPPTGKNAFAFAVDHPKCQYAKITQAIKKEIGAPEEQDDGSHKVLIELQPTTPAKPASGTPKGSVTKGSDYSNPPSSKSKADELQEELERQLKEAAA